jgi:hypothetical protein
MSRLPCSVCQAEVLVAIHQSNGGLCARCVKGQRPCGICGERVSGLLPDGTFRHWDCVERAQLAQQNLQWKTDADIDWQTVREIYRKKLGMFREHVSRQAEAPAEVKLMFTTELNGGWLFGIAREVSNSELEFYDRIIPGWDDDPEGYENAFAYLDHDLDGPDRSAIAERINARFLSTLSEELEPLAALNFGFPASSRVTWTLDG